MTSSHEPADGLKREEDEQATHRPSGHALWGGRFADEPDALMQRINASIDVDRRFALEDIALSRAHCRMLVAQGIIPSEDGDRILAGLDQVEREIRSGDFSFDPALEDIHMHVEARLHEIIGPAAGRLHTARSRNDQVATDFRLWCRRAILVLDAAAERLQRALLARAEAEAGTVMPGFTHLQIAQPVTFGHHLMAYVEMLFRDRGRLRDAYCRMNESPLGAAALAGTGFPIDREVTAEALGFDRPMANSLDAVSARDFALELLAAVDIAALHLSRLAEELVLWSSPAFGFVRMADGFSTGSSIMPQKRNPDAAELVRAGPGRSFGAYARLHTVVKALPLAYAKDLQEDKEPVFQAVDALRLFYAVMAGMIETLTVDRAAMAAMAEKGFATATDLADWLVREKGLPFRQAHHVTGRLVRLAEERGVGLEALSLEDVRAIYPEADESIFAVLDPARAVAARTSQGGTAPRRVREAVAAARSRLDEGRTWRRRQERRLPVGLEEPL
ncbi:MAG: argininosuccinate lyase [Alphaproteobacteria bacterium]|nr:MAG: argininosuccinate lyase [Alphaproteobacteria bacterium]